MSMSTSKWREFYDNINLRLEASGMSDASFFLNYGYADSDASDGSSTMIVPQDPFNSNSAQLVLELIGPVDLNGCVIVDIGCGRGGTVALLAKRFNARFIGIDISPEAIAFCRRNHLTRATHFKVGDALKLPLTDECCDVVINLESSHTYPDIRKFLEEVRRIIRPGGWFFHADILNGANWDYVRTGLEELSFAVETDRDVTANILASRDELPASWNRIFGDAGSVAANFLGVPGSSTYEQLHAHALEYRILRSRLQTEGQGDPAALGSTPA